MAPSGLPSRCYENAQVAVIALGAWGALGSPAQTLTTLYSFNYTNGTGTFPQSALVQAPDGYLYGTAAAGGAHHDGTIFKISPAGTLTEVYTFCSVANCADGADPGAGPCH
jgi:uncharacterized repeat protein (TIGR03803 family)